MAGTIEHARLHDRHIAPREYARQEARRGRRHAFARLPPARTALIVIDMVPVFMSNPSCRGIIPQIDALAGSLRGASGTAAWVLPSGEARHPALAREFYGGALPLLGRRRRPAALHNIYRMFGDVRPASDIVRLVEAG